MRRIYEFGEYQLDVLAFELRRAGVRIDVQPKVLRLLGHLIGARERAVSSEELMRLLWPEEIVGDGSLKRAVCGARQAIGERGGRASRIRTVHRFGYQFVGSAREVAREQTGRQVLAAGSVDHHPSTAGTFCWGGAASDLELVQLLERARRETAASPAWITISSRSAGAGRTHLLDRLIAIAKALGVPSWIARCAPLGGARPHDVFAQLIEQAALQRGAIVVGLDDIHHCDARALSWLQHQLQTLRSVRVVLIATSRGGLSPEIEAVCTKLSPIRVTLSGLSREVLRDYAALAMGQSPSTRLVDTVHAVSAGNPLFLRLLLGIWRSEGRATWSKLVRPLLARHGASEASDLVTQYLRFLPEDTAKMLRIAALLGSSFSAERLATLSLMRPEDQDEGLQRVCDAGLVLRDRTNREVFRFVHAAVRAALQGRPPTARPYEMPSEAIESPRLWRKVGIRGPALPRVGVRTPSEPAAVGGFFSSMGAVNEEA